MRNSLGTSVLVAVSALSAALLLAQAPETNEAKTKAEAKAKAAAKAFEASARVLTIFEREGKTVRTIGERAIYSQPVFSPDGTRILVIKADLDKGNSDVWVMDVASGASTRITSSQEGEGVRAPVWSPSGSHVAYVAMRSGNQFLYRKAATGEGPEDLIYAGAGIGLTDWSLDGRYLTYYSLQLNGNTLFALPLEGERKPVELYRSEFQILEARISPGNRLIAYRSNETGKNEIFVRPFNPVGVALNGTSLGPWQVSNSEGGLGLISWRPDGTELYYMGTDRGVKAVSIRTSPLFEVGKPRTMFTLPDAIPVGGLVGLTPGMLGNISRDGQRLVFAVPPPAPAPQLQQITVYDREGKVVRKVGDPGRYTQPAFSPDGTRLVAMKNELRSAQVDFWTFDIATGKGTQVTDDVLPKNNPKWSPDGSQILYVSNRGGYNGVYRRAADGTGGEELLFRYTPGAGLQLFDVSLDGKFLAIGSGGVVLVVALTGTDPLARKAIEFSREEFNVGNGRFSPDGRFLAYVSNEINPERYEIYVRAFDASTGTAGDGKWQVSTDGVQGMFFWRGDAKEILWRGLALSGNEVGLMSVGASTTPVFQAGTPKLLFKLAGTLGESLGISRDGRQFVFAVNVPAN